MYIALYGLFFAVHIYHILDTTSLLFIFGSGQGVLIISYIMISFCSGPLSSMLHYIVHYDVFFSVVSSLAAWSGRPCCDLAKNRVCELACREVSSNN